MRVLLIDDHTLFRSGLRELLERRGIEVCGSVGDGREGVEAVKSLEPNVVLLDMRMPELNGLEVLRRMGKECPNVPVSVLTTSRDERDLIESLRAGAKGYLLKGMEPDALVTSLNDVVAGKTVVAPDLTAVLARVVQGDEPLEPAPSRFSELTPRETEILCHLAAGQSNKVIARHLGISDGTVKLHVKSILRKLHVHSRVEAAVIAVEAGICRSRED